MISIEFSSKLDNRAEKKPLLMNFIYLLFVDLIFDFTEMELANLNNCYLKSISCNGRKKRWLNNLN